MDVKTTCLGVLMLGEASGYQIKKHFEEGPFSHFCSAGFGSIYPALNKALAEGLVTCRRVEQDGKPDKKVYAITETGRAVFRRALDQQPEPDQLISDTCLRFFFAEIVAEDSLEDAFDAYHLYYRTRADHLAGLSDEGFSGGRLFVRGLARVFHQTVADYLERNKDKLFEACRSGELKPGMGNNTGDVILQAIEGLQAAEQSKKAAITKNSKAKEPSS